MSDAEEPPTKVTKVENENESVEEPMEELEEGQEEWLSEGLLTDDDLNPATENQIENESEKNQDEQQNDSNATNISQDEMMASAPSADTSMETDSQPKETKLENIEKTLISMDSESQQAELDEFLVRKSEIKEESVADDGNDTDDLLRLLGEDEEKTKKKVLIKTAKDKGYKKEKGDVTIEKDEDTYGSSDDDDDYIFEGATVTKLKVAKNALIRKFPAAKAEPETMSDGDDDATDASSDEEEAKTLKNMFSTRKRGNFASKSTTKPPHGNNPSKQVTRIKVEHQKHFKTIPVNKNISPKPILKNSQQPVKQVLKTMKAPVKTVQRPTQEPKPTLELDEIINEEEFLEDDDFDLDDDFASDTEVKRGKQLIMKPEQMDEEVPTDGESDSDVASLYDELPSSDSDGDLDYFALDIRAERAGDYIPLLGAKAYELLTDERNRVSDRLSILRTRIAALADGGKHQANMLQKATITLAELDDMLKAT